MGVAGKKAMRMPMEPSLWHCTPVPAPKGHVSRSVVELNAFAQRNFIAGESS